MSARISITTTTSLKESPVLAQPLASPIPARSGSQIVTPEWLLSSPTYSWDPPMIRWLNNTHLLYGSSLFENKQEQAITLLDIHTGENKILGKGSHPNPSPNGQWIAFIYGEKEAKQLWIMECNGSNRRQLSYIQGGLGESIHFSFDFAWAPNSKKVALKHQPSFSYWEKKAPPKSTIDIIDIITGCSQYIASFEASIRSLSWFPDGKKLLFMKECNAIDYDNDTDRTWIQSLDIKDGQVRILADFDGLQQFLMPTVSLDGQWTAFMYDADHPMFNFMTSLCLIPNESTNKNTLPLITRLTHEMKVCSPHWSHDEKYIYVRRAYGAYKQIYRIDVKTGEPSQITAAPLNIENYALSPDGSRLAWIGQDAHAIRMIRVSSNDGSHVRDLAIIPSVPEDMALSEVREIEWTVPDYPSPMRGLLFMPLNYHQGTRCPLIVDIHGGGAGIYLRGGILVGSPLEWHMWAAKGYAVFVPEFRSSASFGSLAITRDDLQEHDIINCDIKDIEAGIDELITQDIVDSHRLAVIGHSAGGRRVNWLLAITNRFQAAISKEGWADEWIGFLAEPYSQRGCLVFGGTPWEVPENYLKNSALYHCNGATTPTLFLMGNPELGGVDRYNTVHMLYNALKSQGVETEYVKYSDEGHLFEKPENQQDALARSIKWIDEHMK